MTQTLVSSIMSEYKLLANYNKVDIIISILPLAKPAFLPVIKLCDVSFCSLIGLVGHYITSCLRLDYMARLYGSVRVVVH